MLEDKLLAQQLRLSRQLMGVKQSQLIRTQEASPKGLPSFKEQLRTWATLQRRITDVLDKQCPQQLESETLATPKRETLNYKAEIAKYQLVKPRFLKKLPKARLYHRQILPHIDFTTATLS